MTIKPIPMKDWEIRAIQREIEAPGSGKTQTRWILSPQPSYDFLQTSTFDCDTPLVFADSDHWSEVTSREEIKALHAPGDLLWVREASIADKAVGGYQPHVDPDTAPNGPTVDVIYRADDGPNERSAGPWTPPIHMPRRLSRLTLWVTNVRVQRLQEITNDDCIAEGVPVHFNARAPRVGPTIDQFARVHGLISHYGAEYMDIWDTAHGSGAWDKNPWVWAITFQPIAGNVDQINKEAS